MPSFQRDVTQTMNVGPAQAPVGKPSLEGLASMATFAIGKYQQTQKQNRQEEVLQAGERMYEEFLSEVESAENPDMARKNAMKNISKKFKGFAGNHEELRLLREVFARNSGGGLQQGILAETMDPSEQAAATKDRQVNSLLLGDPSMLNAIGSIVGTDLVNKVSDGVGTEEDKQKMLRAHRQVVAMSAQAEAANARITEAQELAGEEALRETMAGLHDQSKSGMQAINLGITEFKSVLNSIPKMPTEQQADAFKAVRNNYRSALGTQVERIQQSYNDVLASGKFIDSKERAALETARDSKVKQLNDSMGTLDTLTDEQLTRMPKYLESLKSRLNIEATEAMGILAKIKGVLGEQAVASHVNQFVNSTGEVSGMIKSAVADAYSGLVEDGTLSQGDVDTLRIKRIYDLYGDADIEQNQELAGSFYKDFGLKIQKGEVSDLSVGALQQGTSNLIKVLKLAEDSNDPQDRKNATELLNSKGFSDYFNKLDEPDKKVVGNMVTNFNHDKITDNAVGLIKEITSSMSQKDVVYNSTTGKFELLRGERELADLPFEERAGEGVIGTVARGIAGIVGEETPSRLQVDDRKIKEFNQVIDTVEQYKEYDAFFKDMSRKEIADFLVTFSPDANKVKVKGSMTKFTPTHKEARETGVDAETLEKERTEKLEFNNRLNELVENSQTLVSAGLVGSLQSVLQDVDPAKGQSIINNINELVSKVETNTVTGDEDIVQIMKENPNLTYAEALELKKQVGE